MLLIQAGTKNGGQEDDKNIPYDDDVEYDEVDDLNEDNLHLRSGLEDNINDSNNKFEYLQEGGILNEDEGQGNHFNNVNNIPLANNVPLAQNDHFGGANNDDHNDDGNNGNNNENQNNHRNNPNQVSDVDEANVESYDDFNYGNDPENNNENNQYSEDEKDDGDNSAITENDDQDTNNID